jgi:hypothetical protein
MNEHQHRLRLDCIHLGEVLDRLGCNCQKRWLRRCDVHQTTTLRDCAACSDYEPEREEE